MASNHIWIMDGHNMIFAIRPLQRLQVSDRREEARSGLTETLEKFAIARSQKVLVVFDGNELSSNPEATRTPLLEIVYSRRGEGVADDRILREAGRFLERGLAVTVVTDDLHTLARELPRGARHLGVQEFWLKHIEKDAGDAGEGGKRVEGDFSDVEREKLARAAVTEPASTPRAAGHGTVASPAPGKRSRASGADTSRGRVLQRREKGQLRQERRLKVRAKPGPRRCPD